MIRGLRVVLGLVVAGVLASLILGMAFFNYVVGHHELPVGMITGVWFIPVVVLVIVPSVIIRVLRIGIGVPEALATFLAIAAWGAGMMLFVFPVAAFTALTAELAHRHDTVVLDVIAGGLWVVLLGLWALLAALSVRSWLPQTR